jgi:hypothetical protein
MALRSVIPKALASLVRAASAAAFSAVLLAVAVTSGPLDWAPWRRMGLGWRFWMGLGSEGAFLAIGSLLGSLWLSVPGHMSSRGAPEAFRRYAWLNIGTIILSLFVPAIAAI